MGRRKTQIIHEGEGIIRNIKWRNDLIAWCNDKVNKKTQSIFYFKDSKFFFKKKKRV
jgi:hypothetical protein